MHLWAVLYRTEVDTLRRLTNSFISRENNTKHAHTRRIVHSADASDGLRNDELLSKSISIGRGWVTAIEAIIPLDVLHLV